MKGVECCHRSRRSGRKEMFYLTTRSTHFIYGYMASDIWLRTILIVKKETRCRHIGYSFRLTARVLLYAPSHRQNSTYHGLCYTSRGALAGMREDQNLVPVTFRGKKKIVVSCCRRVGCVEVVVVSAAWRSSSCRLRGGRRRVGCGEVVVV